MKQKGTLIIGLLLLNLFSDQAVFANAAKPCTKDCIQPGQTAEPAQDFQKMGSFLTANYCDNAVYSVTNADVKADGVQGRTDDRDGQK